jgi:hypothetical protein
MLRGELSNRPAGICGVDYRILLREQKAYAWFVKFVPELLLHKSFETRMRNALPFKPGAKAWLETNWEKRLVAVSVGVPLLTRAIEMVLGDYLAEVHHFDDRYEYQAWIRRTPQVYKVFTEDPALIGLRGITVPFNGWHERA